MQQAEIRRIIVLRIRTAQNNGSAFHFQDRVGTQIKRSAKIDTFRETNRPAPIEGVLNGCGVIADTVAFGAKIFYI